MNGRVLALDVYGTLVDTAGVTAALERYVGARARAVAALWRDKQLEYSFRRGLMGRYRPFPECTAQALDYCLRHYGLRLAAQEREALLEAYRRLPAFPEVPAALRRLREVGFRLFAFSNGIAAEVRGLLAGAGVEDLLEAVVSVDEVQRFKPDPAVYAHFLRRAGCRCGEAWLISSNPFDVMGARSAGMSAAWVRRAPDRPFDPWGEFEPDLVVTDLSALAEALTTA